MRPSLIWMIALAGIIVSEACVFGMVRPPDIESAVLGGLWVASPYLLAAGLAFLFRHRPPAIIALLVSLLIVGVVGISLLGNLEIQHEAIQRDVDNAVQPGEDPNSGPAAMRKSGAEAGAGIVWLFSILLCAMLPPIQFVLILIPATITFACSSGPGQVRR